MKFMMLSSYCEVHIVNLIHTVASKASGKRLVASLRLVFGDQFQRDLTFGHSSHWPALFVFLDFQKKFFSCTPSSRLQLEDPQLTVCLPVTRSHVQQLFVGRRFFKRRLEHTPGVTQVCCVLFINSALCVINKSNS